MALDLEDAYNRVCLPVLADKMLHLGIPTMCIRWILSALNQRRVVMKRGDWRSEWATISTGLPQGSPLSPVLFNIYTLDLAKMNDQDVRVMTFADDILVHAGGKSSNAIMECVQPKLNSIESWCKDNGMTINPNKAKALYLSLNNRTHGIDVPSPTFGGTMIAQEGSLCYLGVIFDRQLNFSLHVDRTIVRATKGLNALRTAAACHAEERHLVMLYRSLVLSIIEYALPMLQLSENQLNRLERLQNACMRIITGCTRSTPIPVLQYLTGLSSITDNQSAHRAALFAKAWQDHSHPMHDLSRCYSMGQTVPAQPMRTLRHVRQEVAPRTRLKRKSWLEHAANDCKKICSPLFIADRMPWSRREIEEWSYEPDVIVRFNRECREWPCGAAEAACRELLQEIGSGSCLVIATDGSFTPDTIRAGWGLAAYLDGRMVMEMAGACNAYVSSTRMEMEALRQALLWLSRDRPEAGKVVFGTDSMAVLQRIQCGWLPDGWSEASDYLCDKLPSFVYLPGHAGVRYNERADELAGRAEPDNSMRLYHQDVSLMCERDSLLRLKRQVLEYDEGQRLIDCAIPFGSSKNSRFKGPTRCHHNQISTGNISKGTLHLLLIDRIKMERVCELSHPQ